MCVCVCANQLFKKCVCHVVPPQLIMLFSCMFTASFRICSCLAHFFPGSFSLFAFWTFEQDSVFLKSLEFWVEFFLTKLEQDWSKVPSAWWFHLVVLEFPFFDINASNSKESISDGFLVGGWTTHLKNMLVNLDHFPKVRGKNQKCFKPPLSLLSLFTS